MPRKQRIIEIGKVYHVFNRGIEKREIFLDNQDYSRFLLGLEFFNQEKEFRIWQSFFAGSDPANAGDRGKEREKREIGEKIKIEREQKGPPLTKILAFCLMPNHFHLIIEEIKEGGLKKFMQKLTTGYASYFNKRYGRSGSLFQSRYKALPIEKESHFNAILDYVHANPLEILEKDWETKVLNDEEIVKRYIQLLAEYKWSSFSLYLEKEPRDINTRFIVDKKFFSDFYGSPEAFINSMTDWLKLKAQNQIPSADYPYEP